MQSVPRYGYPPPISGQEQIERILDILGRRKWVILSVFLACTLGAAAYTFTRTPEYETSSVVMLNLQQRAGGLPQLQAAVPAGDQLFATNGRTLAGELFVLQNSTAISERVYRRLAEMHGQDGSTESSPAAQGHAYFTPASRGEINAIRIVAVSTDPEKAALLANAYADEYVHLTQEASRTYMSASREFLEQQEQLRREELREVEERYAAYLKEGNGVALSGANGSLVEQIAQLEAQRDNARVEMQMRQRSMEARENELNRINPQLASRFASDVNAKILSARERLMLLETQRKDILTLYPEGNERELAKTDYAALNSRINLVKQEIERLSEEYVNEVMAAGGVTVGEEGLSYVVGLKRQIVEDQISISGISAEIEVLDRRLQEYEKDLNALPGQTLQLARIERSKQHAEQMYQFVVQRLQETRIAEESEPGYARVLRPAIVPAKPVHPDNGRNMILGAFFGVLLGLGFALVLDKVDNRAYKAGQLRKLGYDVIGVIPNMEPLIREDFQGAEFLNQEGQQFSTSLLSLLNPMSAVAEAYRQLRTNIQFSRPDVMVQVIMVTGAGIAEGKSTTAANLAVTMAQAKRRTLLIDADLRRPQQHRLFGLDRQAGLVELLFATSPVEMHSFRQVADDLFVVPAGGVHLHMGDRAPAGTESARSSDGAAVTNIIEFIGSKRMRDLLQELRTKFDVIIIDTPPVLAAADAMLLSTQSDATLLVVRAGQTKVPELEQATMNLEGVGAQIIGAVLNAFDVRQAYGEKYRYQHYSKYGLYSKYGYAAAEGKGKRRGIMS